MALVHAFATGRVADKTQAPFAVHASLESPTHIHFTVSAASTSLQPFTQAYRLSSESSGSAGQCSLKSFLSRFTQTVTWNARTSSTVPAAGVGAVCDVCGECEGDVVAQDASTATVRTLRLLCAAQGNDSVSPRTRGPVQLALDNASWSPQSHVSVDAGVLFACGCVFLLRVHLPVTPTATAAAAAEQVAHVDWALRVPVSHLFSPSRGAADRSSQHLSMATVSTAASSSSSMRPRNKTQSERLCVMASLDSQRVGMIVLTRTRADRTARTSSSPPALLPPWWQLEVMGALSVELHHAHPFHIVGRCTRIRQLQWLPGSTDFTGQYPLVAVLHQHDMSSQGTEPPAEHLFIASVAWRTSSTTTCKLLGGPSAEETAACTATLCRGTLADGPWAMKHLALSSCASYLVRTAASPAAAGHLVGLLLRSAGSPFLPSPALRAAATTLSATCAAHTGKGGNAKKEDDEKGGEQTAQRAAAQTLLRPVGTLELAQAQAQALPVFCLLDLERGVVTDVPLSCGVESAVSLAVLADSGDTSAPLATIAALGWPLEKPSAAPSPGHKNAAVTSPPSFSTPTSSAPPALSPPQTLVLLHVRAHSSDNNTETEVLYVDLPETLCSDPNTVAVRLVGGWWCPSTRRGVVRIDQLGPHGAGGTLAWGPPCAISLSVVSGRLEAAVITDTALTLGRWLPSSRPFTLTDLLVYHQRVIDPVRELDMASGSPNVDPLGMEVVLHAPLSATAATSSSSGDAGSLRFFLLLLRNGCFLSVAGGELRVLSRLSWPTSGPTSLDPEEVRAALSAQQAAVEVVLSGEQDAALCALVQLSPPGQTTQTKGLPPSTPHAPLLMVCVAKGWAMLIEPMTGQLRQALRLCGLAGFAPSQLTLLPVDQTNNHTATSPQPTRAAASSRACAVAFVAGLATSVERAVCSPADVSDISTTTLTTTLASLTLTERVYQPLPPVCTAGLPEEGRLLLRADGQLDSALEARQRVAAALAAAQHAPQYDLSLGDAIALVGTGEEEAGLCYPPACLVRAEQAPGGPVFTAWLASSPTREPVHVTGVLTSSEDSNSSVSGQTSSAAAAGFETRLVTLTTCTNTDDHNAPDATQLLGSSWPASDRPLFMAITPLRACSATNAAAYQGVAVLTVHHHRKSGDSLTAAAERDSESADMAVSLCETVLLVWPDTHASAGGETYRLYQAPLASSLVGHAPAVMVAGPGQTVSGAGTSAVVVERYLVAPVSTSTPLSFDVNWSVATSAPRECDTCASGRPSWRGPLAPPSQWLTLSSR